MKIFIALIQAFILGLAALLLFEIYVIDYQKFALMDTNTLAQQYITENSKEQPSKHLSHEQAVLQAEKDIITGKSVLAASPFKIRTFRIIHILGSAVLGFFAWFIGFFIVSIVTHPLDSLFDSILGNFIRYFLVPMLPISIFGIVVVRVTADFLIHKL